MSTDYIKDSQPAWLTTIVERSKSANARVHLLHSNIRDIVFDPDCPPENPDKLLPITEFINQRFWINKDISLYYSLRTGISESDANSNKSIRLDNPRANKTFWDDLSEKVSKDPFPLDPMLPEAKEPKSWRLPRMAIPELTRALSRPVTVRVNNEPDSPSRRLSIGLVIDYLQHIVPDRALGDAFEHARIVEMLQQWSMDAQIKAANHTIVLLTPGLTEVSPELTNSDSRISLIRVDRPNFEQRQKFLAWLADNSDFGFDFLNKGHEPLRERLARLTPGMNYADLLQLIRTLKEKRSTATDIKEWEKTWQDFVKTHRNDTLERESGGLLKAKDSAFGLQDVAGYEYVKTRMNRWKGAIQKNSLDISGILFAGPPGTGKSFFASALAKEANLNVLTMRNVRNMYVGESERNMERILDVARSFAPVVIFIDEIDQAFQSRDDAQDNTGVSQRLLGMLLSFMEEKENQGKVLWIAASNRPDLLDSALLSRFKEVIPFLLPDKVSCQDLLQDKLPKQSAFRWEATPLSNNIVISVVGKYAGRELETIVKEARRLAEENAVKKDTALTRDANGQAVIPEKFLADAISSVKPAYRKDAYLYQSLLALHSAKFASSELAGSAREVLPALGLDDTILDGMFKEEDGKTMIEHDILEDELKKFVKA